MATKDITSILISSCMVFGFFLSLASCSYSSADVLFVQENDTPQVKWLVSQDNNKVEFNQWERRKRSLKSPTPLSSVFAKIQHEVCQDKLKRLCGVAEKDMDDLFYLECVLTFKPNEVSTIEDQCQHAIYNFIREVTANENIYKMAKNVCGDILDKVPCQTSSPGSYLACLIEKKEKLIDLQCTDYIQRLDWVVNDFKVINAPFVSDCTNDIQKFQCGKILPYKDILQGQTLACLQEHINKLEITCKNQILKVTETQLNLACHQDRIKFCRNIRLGSGQVYKCLMLHKTDISISATCQEQLLKREKLIAYDYRVSRGLVRACKDDIRSYRCRRNVSEDKDIKLAQILLCLESAVKNGSKVASECQAEMFDHRKILMEDYRLSPEIVNRCANDIQTFCNNLEVGGATIHCLMENSFKRRRKPRVSAVCQRALEDLIRETDAGEDWRIDPVLREACQSVVDVSCKDVQGGNAKVISCLMDKLGTDRMTESCETALIQIQYFIARDYKLDPQLYRSCKSDAVHFCHAQDAWAPDGTQMDVERGPLVLPCLYRYAYHPQKTFTLKRECLDEIRRVMRQRAVNVDLQPEIEEVCLDDLASFCFDKTAKGEEILCLQDRYESLTPNCKLAVGNFTEEQAERVELNPIITTTCRHIMEKHCGEILKYGKDEGDMMDCLIEHKNDFDSRTDSKCKAAVEHFQLISLKNYHFTFKFKEACRPMVIRWCPQAKTKSSVVACLSDIVQNDIVQNTQFRISKECRQQLKAQLYQQRENIKFDPKLRKVCANDTKILCGDVEPGNAMILECLAKHKNRLSENCHSEVFKIRKQEFSDNSVDYSLMNVCHTMIKQFCHDVDRSKALDCLKRYKDEAMFDDNCRTFVMHRMAEQNTDFRFNPNLQYGCMLDIKKYCKNERIHAPEEKEVEGKVIGCLKIKFKESKLTIKCEKIMETILREAALNYHLNPLISTMCADEIIELCGRDETNSPGVIEECLKEKFMQNNKNMKEACRIQVAEMIEEAKADINVDPLLQKACAVDVSKFCYIVPQGAGRHIDCLQNVLQDKKKKSLQPDCYKMLTSRLEMFRIAEKLAVPQTIEDLYTTVNRSPAKHYFILLAFASISFFIVVGMFFGRMTNHLVMKNK